MFNNFVYPCTVLELLVGVRAGTIMDMVVEVEVLFSAIRTNVLDNLWINLVTDELSDMSNGMYADILVTVGVSEVEIIVAAAAVIALEFVLPKRCAVDFLTDMLVVVIGDAFSGALAGVISCVVPGIGVDMSTKINVNVLTAVTTVEIAVPTPL